MVCSEKVFQAAADFGKERPAADGGSPAMHVKNIVSASILGANLVKLGDEIIRAYESGVEYLHFDVMDGVFVPNISYGQPVLCAVKKSAPEGMVMDVHLMITQPHRYIEDFSRCGADIITIHEESGSDISAALDLIHSCGCRAGLSIKPATPAEAVFPYLDKLDMVLVMTVEPGFGGQGFIRPTLDKISAIRSEADRLGKKTDIQVDGGINDITAPEVKARGANVLVSGSWLFSQRDMKAAVTLLNE